MNKYVANAEGKCPKCGAINLDYQGTDIDGSCVSYHWVCNECNAHGIEYYFMTFDGHSVHNDEINDLEDVNQFIFPGCEYNPETHYFEPTPSYVIIDKMENEIYYYGDDITMGFAFDNIIAKRDRLGIPYKIVSYNNGKVIVIKNV